MNPTVHRMTSETALSAEWLTLRDSLSKAYVAADIDAALRYSRPRIEAAARSQPATEDVDVERLARALLPTIRNFLSDTYATWDDDEALSDIRAYIAPHLAAGYASLAATEEQR